jgi:hypothetical protein
MSAIAIFQQSSTPAQSRIVRQPNAQAGESHFAALSLATQGEVLRLADFGISRKSDRWAVDGECNNRRWIKVCDSGRY